MEACATREADWKPCAPECTSPHAEGTAGDVALRMRMRQAALQRTGETPVPP